ncbi:DNA helicase/exodeoxyribonuclease V alpha subunit [Mesocricetibacter intestinalis]|uniref:RecBCD enzyme subunit RecD n=1 Tax=Mesocricetibacter intestinalis TaxID=1521930 RepID=A0A4R6VES0_9PAST|nr:exodeoxyribonuclease V subunit alpha [Mesocricetibacter intestinalis]TDQ58980.1 DNA helicase/exodeoxyribonuclease V alpha subunit [Mesocricetibacter intestinalis]
MLSILAQLKQQQLIGASEYYFAALIAEKQRPHNYSAAVADLAVLLAALITFAQQRGNTCLFLNEALLHNPFELAERAEGAEYLGAIRSKIEGLPLSRWQEALAGHIAFSSAPRQRITPLVFQFNALYFYRSWQDEYFVARYLKRAVKNSPLFTDSAQIEQVKALLKEEQSCNPGQKIAIAAALRQQFCLISGGPGTGKTFTVARLLIALQKLNGTKLHIRLAAPTGKAAARLSESIADALNKMSLPAPLRQSVPNEGMTVHRLLGEGYPRGKGNNPLPADVLVVDEASMLDLRLLAELLKALKPDARLILLGDKDQLASVEAGAVIGELGAFLQQGYGRDFADYLRDVTGEVTDYQAAGNPIRDHLCYLYESRRFGQHSGIGRLAKAVNEMQAESSLSLFEHFTDIEFIDAESAIRAAQQNNPPDYAARAVSMAVKEYLAYLNLIRESTQFDGQSVARIFNAFKRIRFLTALRSGESGVELLNQRIAEGLRRKGALYFKHSRDWYVGKPVMVIRNDSNVGLFNGDIGLFFADKVWFETGEGQYKAISPSRVPAHETAFVMTVHKSQGSEFEHTFLILPPHNSPLLSKELVYTAVTRAKSQLSVFGTKNVWKSALRKSVQRQSGLGRQLQQD